MCKSAAKPRPEPDFTNLETEAGADQFPHQEPAEDRSESRAASDLGVFGDADGHQQNHPEGKKVQDAEQGVEEPVGGKGAAGREVDPLRGPAGDGVFDVKAFRIGEAQGDDRQQTIDERGETAVDDNRQGSAVSDVGANGKAEDRYQSGCKQGEPEQGQAWNQIRTVLRDPDVGV